MKSINILLLLLPIAFTVFPLSAQSNTSIDDLSRNNAPAVVQDVDGLRAEFKQGVQDPESKTVKFEMILKSDIDSDRVQINWEVDGVSIFKDKSKKTANFSIEKGKTYSLPIEVTVVAYGVTELRGTVQAFKADSSYLATVRKNFASNESFEVMPLTQEYTTAKNLVLFRNIIIITSIVLVTTILGLISFKRFTKWVNKEDKI